MGSRDDVEGYYDALAGLPEEIGASEDYYNGYDDGRRTLENVSVKKYSSGTRIVVTVATAVAVAVLTYLNCSFYQ